MSFYWFQVHKPILQAYIIVSFIHNTTDYEYILSKSIISVHKKGWKVFHCTSKLTHMMTPEVKWVPPHLIGATVKWRYFVTRERRENWEMRKGGQQSGGWLQVGKGDWMKCIMNLLKSKDSEGQFYWAAMTGKLYHNASDCWKYLFVNPEKIVLIGRLTELEPLL